MIRFGPFVSLVIQERLLLELTLEIYTYTTLKLEEGYSRSKVIRMMSMVLHLPIQRVVMFLSVEVMTPMSRSGIEDRFHQANQLEYYLATLRA